MNIKRLLVITTLSLAVSLQAQSVDTMQVRTFYGHGGTVSSVAFSPDGRYLASGSTDHTVNLWQTIDGKHLMTLRGHTDNIEALAFSPDGRILASASSDGLVRLWHINDGKPVNILSGHEEVGRKFTATYPKRYPDKIS